MRAITFLNEAGDTTIVWTPDRDAEMELIIQKKMDEGVMFYIIDPRFGMREKLTDVRDASRHRMLAIPDEDMAKFVGMSVGDEASAAVVATPKTKAKNARRGRSAKEVVKSESVAVRPRKGG